MGEQASIAVSFKKTTLPFPLHSQTDKRTGLPKVWIYKDKNTGVPKGEATITFDDPETAKAAINWFDGRCFETSHRIVPVNDYRIGRHIEQFSYAGHLD